MVVKLCTYAGCTNTIDKVHDYCKEHDFVRQIREQQQLASFAQQHVARVDNISQLAGGSGGTRLNDWLGKNIASSPTGTMKFSTTGTEIKKEKNVLNSIKEYLRENRSIIFTVLTVVAIDHFFLNGKLKEKIQSILENMLAKVEGKATK